MARPQTITNSQILEAAHAVFLDKGYSATTAEIAQRAGISEGTLFRRYENKDALFLAALGFDREPPVIGTIERLTTDPASFEERLRELSGALLDFYSELIPAIGCLKSSPISLQEVLERDDEPPPARVIHEIERFFETATSRGEVPPVDVAVITRVFIGTLHGFAFQCAMGINRFAPLERDRLESGLLRILINHFEGLE